LRLADYLLLCVSNRPKSELAKGGMRLK